MSTNYPGALDNTVDLINNATDATVTSVTHAQAHNNVADSLIAVETALGTNPKGSYASVAAALLDTIVKTPGAAQVVAPSGDTVPLTLKSSNTLNVSNMQEWRDASNVIQAYMDKSMVLSTQGLKIAGTALASTHLSDSAQLARLASPAFSGTPTAPTPTAGDSSTKIATTAFVLSNGVPTGAIMMFAGGTAPAGWVLCDGTAYNGTLGTYSALWAIIGTTYGGTGQTSFNVPDLRGRIPVGKGTNADVLSLGLSDGLSVASRTMKHYHGVGSLALSAHSITDSGHAHGITDPGHYHNLMAPYYYSDSTPSFNAASYWHGATSTNTDTKTTGITINSAVTGISIANHTPSGNVGTTGGVAETPAYLIVNYIIKL